MRLGDTGLLAEVEKDHTVYGDECKFGGGKVLREGMGQASGVGAAGALDTVIMNALIIDAALGIVKADIGIKGGLIVGVGKAGNPDVMDGVTPGAAPCRPTHPGRTQAAPPRHPPRVRGGSPVLRPRRCAPLCAASQAW